MTNLQYENLGITIAVPMPDTDFKVVAMADYDKVMNCYHVKTYMDKKDIDFLDMIDDQIIIESDFNTIKTTLTKYIAEKYDEGLFDSYMKRYDYQVDCIEKGNHYLRLLESKTA